jgi:hypothetical protein
MIIGTRLCEPAIGTAVNARAFQIPELLPQEASLPYCLGPGATF